MGSNPECSRREQVECCFLHIFRLDQSKIKQIDPREMPLFDMMACVIHSKKEQNVRYRLSWNCKSGISMLAIMICITSSYSVFGQDWTRFLGTDGAGTSDSEIPTSWDAETNIRWKTKMPGPGASSPIVLGDKIFLTCYTGYGDGSNGKIGDLKRHLFCMDRSDGKVIWQKTVDNQNVKDEDPYKSYITEHGYATNTPITDGSSLFAFFGKAGVVAYDLDGKELWRTPIENKVNKTRWGSGASPILFGDLLIVNAVEECGKVFALAKSSGEIEWEFDTKSQLAYSTPNLVKNAAGEMELVMGVPEKIIGINPKTGKQKWYAKTTLLNEVNGAIIVNKDIIYVYGGYQGVGSLAIRAGGEGDVSGSHVLWTSRDTSYVSTPVFKDDHLFWVNKSGIAHCVEAATGKRVFRERLDGVEGGRGIKFFASTVAAGNNIYVVSRRSGTFVLAANPEFTVVSHNVIAGDDTEFNGTPAISDQQMFIRSNQYLYCIGN